MTNSKIRAAIYAAIDSPIKSEGTEVIEREGWYQVINRFLKEPSENEIMLSLLKDDEVDRRFSEKGRLMPEGLKYIQSWVDKDLSQCFQVMESDDPALITQWTDSWNDLVDFDVIPIIFSKEAPELVKPLL